MKTIFTILFISICTISFSQVKKDSKATLVVTPNPVQIEKLTQAYDERQKAEIKINELTELTIGHKLDEVDSLRVENGQFKFVLKPKKPSH